MFSRGPLSYPWFNLFGGRPENAQAKVPIDFNHPAYGLFTGWSIWILVIVGGLSAIALVLRLRTFRRRLPKQSPH